jgi:hypothetical protein
MGETAAQIVLYGLLATLSPLAFLSTLVVLGTERPRANGSAFGAGFLLGQTLALAIALVIGSITIGAGGHGTVSGSLELALGVLLIVAALRARRPGRARVQSTDSRTSAVLARLAHVTPRTAFPFGVALGIGIKRLVISTLAASTIALADLENDEAIGLSALYVAVACLTVLLPIVAYLVAGSRADELVADSKQWLTIHQKEVAFWLLLVLGFALTADALVELAR